MHPEANYLTLFYHHIKFKLIWLPTQNLTEFSLSSCSLETITKKKLETVMVKVQVRD